MKEKKEENVVVIQPEELQDFLKKEPNENLVYNLQKCGYKLVNEQKQYKLASTLATISMVVYLGGAALTIFCPDLNLKGLGLGMTTLGVTANVIIEHKKRNSQKKINNTKYLLDAVMGEIAERVAKDKTSDIFADMATEEDKEKDKNLAEINELLDLLGCQLIIE